MPRPKKSEVDAYKDEILAMYEDDVSIGQISKMLEEHGLDISASTLKRRLMAWVPARHPRIGNEEEGVIKSRIHTLVHEHFYNDQDILATLREEGHRIRSLYKVRELRRQAGIPRWRPKDDTEYQAWLVKTVRDKITQEDIQHKGFRQMYASLRAQGVCVPAHRLRDILNEIDPETAAQRRKHMPKGQGLRAAKRHAAAAAAAAAVSAGAHPSDVMTEPSLNANVRQNLPHDAHGSTAIAAPSHWPHAEVASSRRDPVDAQVSLSFNVAFARAIMKTLQFSPAFDPSTIGEHDLVTMLNTGMALDHFADTIEALDIGMTAKVVKLQHKATWTKHNRM